MTLFRKPVAEKTPYHLVTLDMNMPTMDALLFSNACGSRGCSPLHAESESADG